MLFRIAIGVPIDAEPIAAANDFIAIDGRFRLSVFETAGQENDLMPVRG
jgi:hypothetical protein